MDELQKDELIELHDQEEQKERFTVTDLNQADWVLRKLSALDAKDHENQKMYDKNRKRIDDWLAKVKQSTQDSREYLTRLLTDYAVAQRSDNPKFKINTPNGKVTFRKQQPKWIYDEKRLVESLKNAEADDLLKNKPVPDKNKLKQAVTVTANGQVVTSDGILLNGVKVESLPEKVVVTTE
ncbi:hypothetical protein BSQ39_08290 [Loigolactobacillus backii]|uniref:host-nuclease inhibitor Gam family protein n=1 Tax=Loigolactobacillus backii TaxID=375175 RepID=UPI000C1CABDD|nr:host-nuclease inhibitor Gam family protein [Loigolactobacillus backii]PIO83562.1 hypothetical protein BSQ39_08290 [Loigolactobacillus backii]